MVHAIAFIEFILQIRNSIVPFLVNEKIVNGLKLNYVFDGNNRSNAILDFCLQPLTYFPELIPNMYSDIIKDALKKLSLQQLLAPRFTLTKFLRTHSLSTETNEEAETAWDKMIDVLANYDFFNIKLQLCVFDNLTDSQMQTIYEKTNATGVRLTEQELLASSTDSIRFTSADTRYFHELADVIDEDYYQSMNENERLHVATGEHASLNLFEILIALQCKLCRDPAYNLFIAEPSSETDGSLDITFKLYQCLIGDFNVPLASSAMIDEFITIVMEGSKFIHTALQRLYDTTIPLKPMEKYQHLPKNTTLLLLTYIATAKRMGISNETIQTTLLRVILWHDVLQGLTQEGRETLSARMNSAIVDDIQYKSGGNIIPDKLRRIKERGEFEYVPDNRALTSLLAIAMEECTIPSPTPVQRKSRKPLTRFKAFAFTAFYNYQIPSALKREPQNGDHIVPFKTRIPSSMNVNICRLGNLQLITEEVNKCRGTKPITDEWIEANNLRYQHYPSGADYARMCVKLELTNEKAFVDMCVRREQMYMNLMLRTLGVTPPPST